MINLIQYVNMSIIFETDLRYKNSQIAEIYSILVSVTSWRGNLAARN